MRYTSDLTGNDYSKKEFLELLEKRVRKHLRIEKNIEVRRKYALLDTGKLDTELLLHYLEKIFNKRLTITLIDSTEDVREDEELLVADCLETYASKRLNIFFNKEDIKGLEYENAPLRMISAQEVNTAGQLLELHREPVSIENEFIEELHKKYGQTKTSLLKSFDHLAKK